MSPPASTASLLAYIDGNRLFNAKPAIRFPLAPISGPREHVESIRALLVQRSEHLIEIVRSSYLPRLNSQPQRARRDWENLFQLEYSCPDWPDRREPRHGQVWERLP